MKRILLTVILSVLAISSMAQVKRIGLIGLDISHAPVFTSIINDTTGKYPEMEGFQVVVAYPRGSYTIPSSYERIPRYIEEVKAWGVEITSSISELVNKVDYVILTTNDGTMHLEQAVEVFKAGKPVFIDKPLAASFPDAIAILALAEKYNVPCFSASSLRFAPETREAWSGKYGKVIGADSFSAATREPSHDDFTWYGIHGVEILFSVMGTGCKTVTRMSSEGTEVVMGMWNDGRIGTFRGNIEASYGFGGTIFTKSGNYPLGKGTSYDELMKEVVKFFTTGVSPVSPEETMEIFTFMEASNESVRRGGIPVSTQEVYEKNKEIADEIAQKY